MNKISDKLKSLEDNVVRYNYYLTRTKKELNKEDLNAYIRKKVNKKFSDELKEIFLVYFISRNFRKKILNKSS